MSGKASVVGWCLRVTGRTWENEQLVKSISDKGNNQCKGPEARASLEFVHINEDFRKGEWNRMKEWLKFINSAVPWILRGNTGIYQTAMTQLGNIPHLRSELGKRHRNDRFASQEHTVPGLLFSFLGDRESEELWTKKNAPGCKALPRAFACTGIHPLNIKIHLFYIKWWTLQCWTHLLFLKTNDGHQILSNGEGENKSTNDKRLKEKDSRVRAHLRRLFCCTILLKIFTIQLYVPRNLTLESQII